MKNYDIRIDVSDKINKGEIIIISTTVFMPSSADLPVSPIVIFAWPGGGYCRRYYDLQLPGHAGYSQAEFHTSRGIIFVACDHVGVGESTVPNSSFNDRDLGAANQAAACKIVERLREGTLIDGLGPIIPSAVVAMGQSYGGMLLTRAQGNEPFFDGVALLGWSGIQTVVIPTLPPSGPGWAEMAARGLTHPYRQIFHYDDVPETIVDEDMSGYPDRIGGEPIPLWGTRYMPGGPNFKSARTALDPGVVKDEAAAIQCAVFVGVGERDTCPEPRLEPTAYPSSSDITTFVLPRAAHMHNFASTRQILWRRLEAWSRGVQDMKQAEAGRHRL